MRIVVVGGTGTIGSRVVEALRDRKAGHELVVVGHSSGDRRVDLADPASVRELFQELDGVDAVVSAAGVARFGGLAELDDEDFRVSLENKLMGQVNLVRYGLEHVADGGSFTLTSGILAQEPMQGSAAISLVNAGVEGFARAAALEAPRGIRVNVVSPGWVAETLEEMGRDPSHGTPAAEVAEAYVRSVEGDGTGAVLRPAR